MRKSFEKGFHSLVSNGLIDVNLREKNVMMSHENEPTKKKNILTYWQKNVIGLASIFTETVHWSRLDWHLCHNSRQLIDILCTLA